MSDPLSSIDVFVVGAMKAATTTMCDWLDVQQGVALCQPKEPSIFVSDTAAERLRPAVEQMYAGRPADSLRIDGSTDYAKFPAIAGVPERVHRHCPDARIVYLMREPIDRLVSQYRFDWLRGGERLPLDRAVHTQRQLVDNGRYAHQLRQWLDWFPPERFVLVLTEAMATDAALQVGRVLTAVGAPAPDRVVVPEEERSNLTVTLRRPTLARRLLRHSRLGRRLRPLVPDAVTAAYQRRVDRQSVPTLTAATRAELVEVYDRDLADLTALTDGPRITCDTWHEVVPQWTPELSSH